MKHCPKCRLDFAERFELCFTCQTPLEVGGIEGTPDGAPKKSSPGEPEGGNIGSILWAGFMVAITAIGGFWLVSTIPTGGELLPEVGTHVTLIHERDVRPKLPGKKYRKYGKKKVPVPANAQSAHLAYQSAMALWERSPKRRPRVDAPVVLTSNAEWSAFRRKYEVNLPRFDQSESRLAVIPLRFYRTKSLGEPEVSEMRKKDGALELVITREHDKVRDVRGTAPKKYPLVILDEGEDWVLKSAQYLIAAQIPRTPVAVTFVAEGPGVVTAKTARKADAKTVAKRGAEAREAESRRDLLMRAQEEKSRAEDHDHDHEGHDHGSHGHGGHPFRRIRRGHKEVKGSNQVEVPVDFDDPRGRR